MSKLDDKGTPARAHLKAAARRGSTVAKKALIPPPFPVSLSYLWEWVHEIRMGIVGDGFGAIQLSWTTLHAWATLTRNELAPHETRAIFALHAALTNPVPSR
ncbi:MAG TPA: hypothetical protein VGM50_23005 [Gemmatimonadaceae bacterium]